MIYLRKYNEELKSDTYKSAADKLAGIGHIKRPEELMKWHAVAKEKEKEEEERKAIEESSELGTYKITIHENRNNMSKSFTGDFYINFYWNTDVFDEYYKSWREFDNHYLWLTFEFCILAASEESKDFINSVRERFDIRSDGKLYLGYFGLNLSGFVSSDENELTNSLRLRPNSGFYWESSLSVDWYISDRVSARKFKKMLYDIFEGNIVLGETPQIPGGVKEQILDFLCSDMDHTLEEFEEFIESLKRINLNKIYKD